MIFDFSVYSRKYALEVVDIIWQVGPSPTLFFNLTCKT